MLPYVTKSKILILSPSSNGTRRLASVAFIKVVILKREVQLSLKFKELMPTLERKTKGNDFEHIEKKKKKKEYSIKKSFFLYIFIIIINK